MSTETIKMLVLETDSPHPHTLQETGSFGQVFSHVFKAAGQNHNPPLGIDVDMHYVVDDPAKGKHGHVPKFEEIPEDVRAVLITGSLYDAHGNDPWIQDLRSLICDLWRTRPGMKFSGICFGHQLLGRVLGAKVEPTPGKQWELAHVNMDLTKVGQKLFVTNDTKLALHQMHQDQVSTIPSSDSTDLLSPGTKVHNWASSEHTKIQGLYIRDRLFTSQGHLEIDGPMVHRQLQMRIEAGAITEKNKDEVQYAEQTSHLEHDGELLAAAILRFFHGDDHDIE
ncbi:class I glutamine amidotransferase-like protein [Hortaea werneckii]|nr:class I glutamine amidotransferase-like protein [Hortaea werneckii]